MSSEQLASSDFKICLGHQNSTEGSERKCIMHHTQMTFCPLQSGGATEDQLQGLLNVDQDHTLGEGCLMSKLQDTELLNNEYSQTNNYITVLFTGRSRMIRLKQNKEILTNLAPQNQAPILKSETLSPIIKSQVEEIINRYLAPPRDGTYRCASCRNCSSCAPLSNLTRKQKLTLVRSRQNTEIYRNVAIVQDPSRPNKLRIIAKLPVNKTDLQSKNYGGVVHEFDTKMFKLGGGRQNKPAKRIG